MTPEQIIARLGLKPHPEGGYYRETYRAPQTIPAEALPRRFPGPRAFSTAIYYLLTPDSFSALHRVRADELYHFYLGDPVELLMLAPDGAGATVTLGVDLTAGCQPQIVVPAGTWQGARLAAGGLFGLLGCTVAPGFEFADFELASRAALMRQYPAHAGAIAALTRE